jgi:hypothetical protein
MAHWHQITLSVMEYEITTSFVDFVSFYSNQHQLKLLPEDK